MTLPSTAWQPGLHDTKYPWWLNLWGWATVTGIFMSGYLLCHTAGPDGYGSLWSYALLSASAMSIVFVGRLCRFYDQRQKS